MDTLRTTSLLWWESDIDNNVVAANPFKNSNNNTEHSFIMEAYNTSSKSDKYTSEHLERKRLALVDRDNRDIGHTLDEDRVRKVHVLRGSSIFTLSIDANYTT